MADNSIEISWQGTDILEGFFKTLDSTFRRVVIEEMTDFGLSVESITKALAPRDTGDLEDSITSTVDLLRDEVFELIVGTNSEYALRRHEEPYGSGTYPKYERGVKYDEFYVNGRGRETRRKPDTRGYKPGRKFLQNAVNASQDDWDKMCERIITRVMEGVL